MEILGASSEEAMVAAYLQAEIASSRYQKYVLGKLHADGKDRAVVDAPDLSNAAANAYRLALLDYRGYRDRNLLFEGFPRDVSWHKAVLSKADFRNVRYLKNMDWWEISDHTREVRVGEANLATGRVVGKLADCVAAVAARLDAGEKLPDIVLAGTSFEGKLVIAEGHARSTAFLRSSATAINAIIGLSPAAAEWVFY